ncbi:MAG: c-type cytochrome [Candidatus Kapabacteria bacterium]|nr:c-type cytochrome [Candidatus Kapabacteria bacterium]
MATKDENRLLEHDADGIQEYDNSLPRWWLYMFYFTIISGVIYMYYYHVHQGGDWNVLWYTQRTADAEYQAEMADAKAALANAPKKAAIKVVLLKDEASLKRGQEIFDGMDNACWTCHRNDLGGQVGPNLTDDHWIHGCSLEEIMTSIRTGYPEKGMLPYGMNNKLSDEDLLKVASYVVSKHGTNPPEPKPIEEGRDVLCSTTPAAQAAQ